MGAADGEAARHRSSDLTAWLITVITGQKKSSLTTPSPPKITALHCVSLTPTHAPFPHPPPSSRHRTATPVPSLDLLAITILSFRIFSQAPSSLSLITTSSFALPPQRLSKPGQLAGTSLACFLINKARLPSSHLAKGTPPPQPHPEKGITLYIHCATTSQTPTPIPSSSPSPSTPFPLLPLRSRFVQHTQSPRRWAGATNPSPIMNSTTGRAGLIRARDDAGGMDKLV